MVGSKTQSDADRQFIIDNLPGVEVLGFINHNPKIAEADRLGTGILEAAPEAAEEVRRIRKRLESLIGKET